jgi:hypothetical protein
MRHQIVGYGSVGLALAAGLLILGWVLSSELLTTGEFSPPDESHSEVPWIQGLHLASDSLIDLSYPAISAALIYLVYGTRRTISFY